jgi:hypothetical protein
MAKDKLRDIHREAVKRFDEARNTSIEQRSRMREDMRMIYVEGGQWEGSLFNGTNLSEMFEGKPRFEVNKVRKEHSRIKSEFRTNRVNVRYRPKDGSEDKLAEILQGMWRTAYEQTQGQEAFDTAFDWSSGCGFGAFKLAVVPEDIDDPESDVMIGVEPLYDAVQSIWFDPNAKRYDKSDAHWAFELEGMTYDRYNELFTPEGEPEQTPTTFKHGVGLLEYDYDYDWYGPDFVWVARYYKRRQKRVRMVVLEDMLGPDRDQVELPKTSDATIQGYIEKGYMEVRTYTRQETVCECYLMDGAKVIEQEDNIPGGVIPIIPVYGHRTYIDSIERADGMVSPAKDAQRLYNMQISTLADVAANSTDTIPILDPEQIRGLEVYWQNRHINKPTYLPLKPMKNEEGQPIVKPTEYLQQPQIPPALGAMLETTSLDIQGMIGDNADRLQANVSAEAIAQVADRVDMQSFLYISNFAKSIERAAKLFMLMARDVYVDERLVRVTEEDGSDSVERINEMTVDEQGNDFVANDMTEARYDVVIDVGPTFSSRRDSTLNTLAQIMPTIAQDSPYHAPLMSMMIQNLDGEGLDDLKRLNRRLQLQQGIVEPRNEQELQELIQFAQQAQQGDPLLEAQQQYLQSEAVKNQTQAMKDAAEIEKKQAETLKTIAETAETAQNISQAGIDQTEEIREQLAGNLVNNTPIQ